MVTKTPGQRLDEMLAAAKQEHDELKVQIHLAGMEAKQEWEALQDHWLRFCDDCDRATDAIKESESQVIDSLHQVGGEMREAFQRIRMSCG